MVFDVLDLSIKFLSSLSVFPFLKTRKREFMWRKMVGNVYSLFLQVQVFNLGSNFVNFDFQLCYFCVNTEKVKQ